MNRMQGRRSVQAVCINVFVALSLGCTSQEGERQSYLDDAGAFCAVHESEEWADIPGDISADAFNRLVISRQLESVTTQRFRELINQLGEIQFYRELYPTAKREIEAITSAEWDCPPYAAFTTLTVQPEEAKPSELLSLRSDILVTSSGDLFLDQQPLDLESDQLKEFITARESDGPLVIRLEKGVGDEALDPLFRILAELKVTDVSVISDE